MNHALAWLVLGWTLVSGIWVFAEKPYETVYHSNFYLVVAFAVGLSAIALAILTVV